MCLLIRQAHIWTGVERVYMLPVQACRRVLLHSGCLPKLLKEARRNLAVVIEAVSSGGLGVSSEGPLASEVGLPSPESLESLLEVLEGLAADEAVGAGFDAPEVPYPRGPNSSLAPLFVAGPIISFSFGVLAMQNHSQT